VAASEARRCFHKREMRKTFGKRNRRGEGGGEDEERSYNLPIFRNAPARRSSNPKRASQIEAGTDTDGTSGAESMEIAAKIPARL